MPTSIERGPIHPGDNIMPSSRRPKVNAIADPTLREFAKKHELSGLTAPSLRALASDKPGYSIAKARRFLAFQQRIDRELLKHRIITGNRYTAWFRQGEQTPEQIRAFIVQFSVFSNQFLVAQLQKMINADSLEGMRASKEILANEIGVVFNPGRRMAATRDPDREGDPELVSTEGSVEGGAFRFRAAHFEWLLHIAEKLGLSFNDLGMRKHGTAATLYFCDELIRLYGSENYEISQAASYAVENWAAAGFWKELIEGLIRYNARTGTGLPLAFFTWHDRLEAQHALHTQEELEELYFTRAIAEDDFIRYGNEMLDGVAAFWDGLDEQRRSLARAA
jgi:pyrroloquinoline quinone (PQQ) biosynthesis protein C